MGVKERENLLDRKEDGRVVRSFDYPKITTDLKT
jgi:hypothetical protein